ncbi:hypothetical protein ADL04_06535, partial [Streptomyces sp. NRRL B-3648]
AHGGTLVVVPREVTRSPEEFLDLLVEQRVTVLSQTPSAFRSLVSAAASGDERIGRLALRSVIFAGEKLEVGELTPWTERWGPGRVALVNMYGITETTVHTTYHRLTQRDFAPGAGNPIGRPLSDLTIHLLDENGQLVPDGTRGEIHVGGPGVARGYLNRPELTAERFVPDPFGPAGARLYRSGGPAGARLYRSGDLARRRPDGSLEFLGRADDQVKIRGYRIELGEIESALVAQPEVLQAVVVVRDDTLVGYVVPAGDHPVEPARLRDRLGRDLPGYMVPAAYQRIGELPLTANGKLDRRALPAPDRTAYARAAYLAPRTPAEERTAAVWRDVLGVERVGVRDGFFDLGGDSVKAVAVAGLMRADGHDVTARDVLEDQTVEALCARAAASDAPAATVVPVAPFALLSAEDRAALPDGLSDAYPLTQTQTGMLAEMLSADGGPLAYHRVSSVRMGADEPFSREPLHRAVQELVRRHEALRTTVDAESFGTPLQLVWATAPVPLRVVDLTGLDPDGQDRALRETLAEESRTPLPHDTAPLLRLLVHRLGAGAWQLTVTQSHLIVDGWTFATLRGELLALYRAFRDGDPVPPYEPPAVRFADTVAAELTALASEEDDAYWREAVTGHVPFALPDGWGDGPGGARDGYQVRVPVGDLTEGLRALAAAAGVPVKSVWLAAHLKVLAGLTPETRFSSGVVTHCRPEAPGADRVYGTHLNTLPFPAGPLPARWREWVRQVFDRELEVWRHRHFPMPAVQHRYGDGARLVQVYFSYEDFGAADTAPARDGDGGAMGSSHDEFPLAVTAGGEEIVLDVDGRVIGRAHGARLVSLYRTVLEAMAADPDGDARTAVLPDGERELLARWSARPAEPPAWLPPGRFEEWARRTPGATAVVVDDEAVPYGELDAAANRIAHELRALGVGAGATVGLLLGRGRDLPAALLGVWKAGAAYLPLDASFPPERLGRLLTDSGAAALVTESAHTADGTPFFDGPLVLLDRDRERIEARPDTAPERADDPDGVAYVIYTSGSTGRPKGVQITHRGLANFLRYMADTYLADGTHGAPVFSSVAFDMAVAGLLAPLMAGRTVHLFPHHRQLDELGAWLAKSGPFDFVELTPGHLELISAQSGGETASPIARALVVGGETVTARSVAQARPLLDAGGRVVNSYGPTEASVVSNEFVVPDPFPGESVPVGGPLPGVTAHVLDAWLNPVPLGVTGELYIGGAGVARGYAGRPGPTAERFVPDPYGPPGARLYRTGDLARVLPDGSVDFLGRGDGQVKIRGYRIEPGEIEAVLVRHPGVADARVVRWGDGPSDARLVAYLVADGQGAPPAADELRELLSRQLPAYMVPSAFVTLDALPLTANGKLDRHRLPAPDDTAYGRRGTEAPHTPTEQWLAGVWAEVLDVERVGRTDRFFALGGHSLLVFKVLAAARRAGYPLSLLTLYRDDSLRAVAAAVDTARAAAPDEREPAARAGTAAAGTAGPGSPGSLLAAHVPGVSLAVIAGGELVDVRAEGVLSADGGGEVTAHTPFQAGSVSKLVTALGTLRLVDEGVLDLDRDVDAYLTGWRLPDGTGVTLRRLLAHLAGLTPTPSTGQRRGEALVPLPELLAPVRTELPPGTVFRKANVHYSVIQQVLADVTGESLEALMRRLVFEPLAMTGSSFDQTCPERGAHPVARGHDADGRPVDGGWRQWPDTAAAGLWTTAADLAKLLLEIRRSRLGRPLALLRPGTAEQLLTPQHPHSGYGLGAVVDDLGTDVQFGHGGAGDGYHALAMCRIGQGSGFVVLTNGDAGAEIARRCVPLLDARPADRSR